jgi:hypothetical protein
MGDSIMAKKELKYKVTIDFYVKIQDSKRYLQNDGVTDYAHHTYEIDEQVDLAAFARLYANEVIHLLCSQHNVPKENIEFITREEYLENAPDNGIIQVAGAAAMGECEGCTKSNSCAGTCDYEDCFLYINGEDD